MAVSICVPIYDDWENSSLLIENFVSCKYKDVSLVIIDNGSTKSNESVIARISQIENVSMIHLTRNSGFGGAIREASKAVNSDWLAWIPGNMKVLPSEMGDFLALLAPCNEEVFVKAHRVNRPLIDQLKTMVASVIQTMAAGRIMFDTGGTPSAVNRTSPLWGEIGAAPKDYMFDSYILFTAKCLGLEVRRPRVPYHQRLIGSSHWQTGLAAEVSLMARLTYSIIQWRLTRTRRGK